MKVLIAGGARKVELLGSAARQAGIDAATVAEPAGAVASVAALAERLRELEASLTADQPDAVLLADDTDTALAALLVATKACLPAAAAGGAASSSPNGRLIVQLCEERLGEEPEGLGDWARAYTEAR